MDKTLAYFTIALILTGSVGAYYLLPNNLSQNNTLVNNMTLPVYSSIANSSYISQTNITINRTNLIIINSKIKNITKNAI